MLNGTFFNACSSGNLDEVKRLYEEANEENKPEMLTGRSNTPFRFACGGCHPGVVKWLVGQANDEQKQAMLAANEYEGFWYALSPPVTGFDVATEQKSLETLLFLAPLMPEKPIAYSHIDWGLYSSKVSDVAKAFSGSNLLLPDLSSGVPTIAARHFANVGYKLKLLKDAFPVIDVSTMLGEIKRPRTSGKAPVAPWAKFSREVDHVSYMDVREIVDAVREISRYVASYILKTQNNDETLRNWSYDDIWKYSESIENKIAKQILDGRTLPQLKNVSQLWRGHRHALLKADDTAHATLRDFAEEAMWYPLLVQKEALITKKGLEHYKIINLASSKELDEEGGKQEGGLGHCVSTYVEICLKGNLHVFSIQKQDEQGHWHRCTTLGCATKNGKLLPPDYGHHQGKAGREPTAEEKEVANWFINEVNEGRIQTKLSSHSIQPRKTRSDFENRIGIMLEDLTPERMDSNFRTIAGLERRKHYLFGRANRHTTLEKYIASLDKMETGAQSAGFESRQ